MNMPRRKKRGVSALDVITGLLVISAFVRILSDVAPAMANEGEAEFEASEIRMDEAADTGSLLAALQARATRLSEQETLLEGRMAALRQAEEEIEVKIAALQEAEALLSATIALADTAAETDLSQLTTVYENMKPKEAADLFAQMPPQFAAGFLGMMRPDAAALIMTELEPEIAYSFSVVLAGRNAETPTDRAMRNP